ncbi:MAG: ATP-binding protein, partial [Blastococcus sp.]|nr:ATP-binding protein [Blastococcus sp.]
MTYPFSAVVGMDDMRLALLLNAVSPAVGGVLVRGEKGTAKSTTVRALAAVLPPVAVVAGCRFACDPAAPDPACPDGPHEPTAGGPVRPARLVELPVGASEDRVVGSLDLERALTEGVKAFEPGLLAAAHRGVLYVDEVNLLHDHLVDLLLDAAAMGTAYVEREGVSVRHAARFLLVGTMNPEEGELRPQLLDRFGLTVEVAAPRDPAERAEVVRRRFASDADPAGFAATWSAEETGLAARIADARARLPRVVLSDAALQQVTAVCAAFDVDGLRADLVTARAAIAHAAWSGRDEVTEDDVRVAARLALPHRRRRNPFDAPGLDEETLEQALSDSRPEDDGPDGGGPQDGDPDGGGPQDGDPDGQGGPGTGSNAHGSDAGTQVEPPMPEDRTGGPTTAPRGEGGGHTDASPAPERAAVAPSDPFRARRLEVPGIGAGASGRRSRARSERGRVVGSTKPDGGVTKLHLVDTVLAAAPHQKARGRTGPGLRIAREDIRQAVLEGREGNLVLFVVDASGSMGSRARMGAVKGA